MCMRRADLGAAPPLHGVFTRLRSPRLQTSALWRPGTWMTQMKTSGCLTSEQGMEDPLLAKWAALKLVHLPGRTWMYSDCA